MKNTIIAIIAVVLLAGIAGLYIRLTSQKPVAEIIPTQPVQIEQPEQTVPTAPAMASAKYLEYSRQALSDDSSKKRVLFFYASWCPTCKAAEASFLENTDKIPEGVALIRVNYNDPQTDQEEKDLAKKYGITYQHTFVQIDSAGKEVTKWNGGKIEELLSNIQ